MPSGQIICRWDGEHFTPWRRHGNECAVRFTIGADYYVEPQEPASGKSRGHYFASLNEAWKNLPEDQADRFPTVEALRKWALVQAGYRDERTHVCGSAAEAMRLRATISGLDEYAVILARGNVVTIYTAQSQSAKAMGKKAFQESKDAVLGIVANLIGVSGGELERNAGQAA